MRYSPAPSDPSHQGRHPLRAASRILLLLLSIVSTLAAGELLLRALGYRFDESPVRVEFGGVDVEAWNKALPSDPELLWVRADYDARLAPYRGAAAPPSIVFMGDSCTHVGHYDRDFLALVERSHPDLELRPLNVGVGAYSSTQGLAQLRRDIAPLRPAVVTFYYGWNDHWRGVGDHRVARATRLMATPWYGLRLVQLAASAYIGVLELSLRDTRRRVDLDRFEENLRGLVSVTRAAGGTPVLLTAPTAYRKGATPDFLVPQFLAPGDDVFELHQTYVERVRLVARETGAALCDLERRFAELPRRRLVRKLFRADRVHLLEAGDALLARYLHECFLREGLFAKLASPTRVLGPP